MKIHQPILTYLLTFVALSIILKFLGVIDFDNSEILGYALIFWGVSSVYLSFGKNKKILLFSGTAAFLFGVLLFLISNFEFVNTFRIIYPAVLFISGISFLMLFFDEMSRTIYLSASIILLLAGTIITVITGSPNFISFINSAYSIIINYWTIVLIVIGIIVIIHMHEKREK